MSYNPDTNMFAASVNGDTQGIAPGIAAAGQAVATGVGQWASNRAAAKAADLEYETIAQMYPEAAANIDPEKFHAANLAGKQKLLGLAKGFMVDQKDKQEMMRKEAMAQQEMALKSQEMGLRVQDMTQRQKMDALRLNLSERTFSQNADEAAARAALNNRELGLKERSLTAEEEWRQRSRLPQKFTTADGRYNAYNDANGNPDNRFPVSENIIRLGPIAGNIELPISRATAPDIRPGKDGKWYRIGPDGVTEVPVKGATAPGVAGTANPGLREALAAWAQQQIPGGK